MLFSVRSLAKSSEQRDAELRARHAEIRDEFGPNHEGWEYFEPGPEGEVLFAVIGFGLLSLIAVPLWFFARRGCSETIAFLAAGPILLLGLFLGPILLVGTLLGLANDFDASRLLFGLCGSTAFFLLLYALVFDTMGAAGSNTPRSS